VSSTSDIAVDTADGPMPATVATPDGDARGGVVVVQEAFGITDYITDVCRRLADAGWYAVAPALFHRQGSPVFAYDDYDHIGPVMQQLTAGGITTDLDGAFDHLAAAGFSASRSAVVGFCMGGSVTLYAATIRRLGAAVTFYGGGVGHGRFGLPGLVELAPSLGTPWLGLYGDLDKGISIDEVEALRAAAATAPVDTEVVRYADADHGFHCDGRPAVFNQAAADDGWRRTLAWFDDHIDGTRR